MDYTAYPHSIHTSYSDSYNVTNISNNIITVNNAIADGNPEIIRWL